MTSQTQDALQTQWADALTDLDPDTVALVSQSLDRLATPNDIAMEVESTSPDEWTVLVCLADRLGTLSLISGLFTSFGLDIIQADTFTVTIESARPRTNGTTRQPVRRVNGQPPRRRRRSTNVIGPPSRRAVMIFDLHSVSDHPPDWEMIERDLGSVAKQTTAGQLESARSSVIDGFADAMRDVNQSEYGQLPVEITTDNDSSDNHTLLTIESIDTQGFLFAFTNALASLRVNVVRSKIRTVGWQVHNTFWLTDSSGEKIESESRLSQIRVAAGLIKQFTHLMPIAPDPGQALRQFNSLTTQLLSRSDWPSELHNLESPGVLETLAEMMGVSRFLWEDFLRMQHDNLFPVVLDVAGLDDAHTKDSLIVSLDSELEECADHAQRVRSLNLFKDREMFRIDLRYITGGIDFRQFANELTTLAEVIVQKSFELAMDSASLRFGRPMLDDGSVCQWAIFALGKFGGREMGFGSDIELVFVYESEGMTDGTHPVKNSTFFEEVVKGFLAVLETRQQGIFEVDMRLRPYGNKGSLASSLAAFEDYYNPDGDAQQFERLAFVRMRPVAGDTSLADRVAAVRDRFVYSEKPLDVDNIRHLRSRQANELVGRGTLNAKLSPGGLVDIEYYVQSWQITQGRIDPDLRAPGTLDSVQVLGRRGHLDSGQTNRIRQTYSFLRKLIDGLRVVRGNAKDLDIPPADSREFQYLAHRLAVEPPEMLTTLVEECMAFSQRLWDDNPPH